MTQFDSNNMTNKRYQVFLITSGDDTRAERLVLSQALMGIGCFSWGLEQRTPLSTTLARRQIDECDYVVVLLGGKYGEQSVTGDSYMYLEYKYAATRQKPIFVLMHDKPEQLDPNQLEIRAEMKQRFHNFREELKQQTHYTYQTARDIDMQVRLQMPKFIEKYPQVGWIQATQLTALVEKIRLLEKEVSQQGSTSKLPALRPLDKQETNFDHLPKVALYNEVDIDYTIQAYQGGNFKNIDLIRTFTWLQLIELFAPYFLKPNVEEMFTKAINDHLNTTSLDEVQHMNDLVHAVDRAQANSKVVTMIKQQMHHHEWVVPVSQDAKNRVLWQLTDVARKYVERKT